MADDAVEREKLAFEKEKWKGNLDIENKKLQLEKRSRWTSTGGIVIPLLVVAATIYGNTEAQRTQSQADFALKAAEVILQPRSVTESQNRADGLVALLPDRFPSDLSQRLQPLRAKLERSDMDKRGLLNLLAAAPKERRKDILELWLAFYPKDREQVPEAVLALLDIR